MPNPALFIVVSGLPASGKTAIGRRIAQRLSIPFIDKDEFLEAEFEKHRSVDPEIRQRLSRKCDDAMATEARTLGSGVLVSFWRPPGLDVSYGTSTQWLLGLGAPVVELHCKCKAQSAEQRFRNRQRHPGHNDAARLSGLAKQFAELATRGPLGLWPLAIVDTDCLDEVDGLADKAVTQVLELVSRQETAEER